MNYQKIYDNLIDRARHRDISGYVERHHIIPKCLGGPNDSHNIVKLTAEEHFLAHLLLVKLNPGHAGLTSAAWFMTSNASGGRTKNSNKRYGWLRRAASKRIISEETRRKISENKKGKPNLKNRGRKLSDYQIELLKRPKSEEHKEKLRAYNLQPEVRQATSDRMKGKIKSEEHRRKQSETMKGRPSHRKGVPMSEESKRKMSETKKRKNLLNSG